MKHLRGFGKNYFTLAAIQAYSAAAGLAATENRSQKHSASRLGRPKDLCEEDPPPEDETPVLATVECVKRETGKGKGPFKILTSCLLLLTSFPPVTFEKKVDAAPFSACRSAFFGLSLQNAKPFHCNCFFRRLAWLLLHLSERFKRPLCRCRYTKTGLAPPIPR